MVKEQRNFGLWALLLLALSLGGCGEKTTEELMVGDWGFAKEFTDAELAAMMELEEMPPGLEMSMRIEGTQSYQKDGSYSAEADMHMHMSMMGQEMNMALHVTDSGDWAINEAGMLVETSQASGVEPLDEETRKMMAMDPSSAEDFVVPPGTETTFSLNVVSDDEMVHTEQDDGLAIVYKRQ